MLLGGGETLEARNKGRKITTMTRVSARMPASTSPTAKPKPIPTKPRVAPPSVPPPPDDAMAAEGVPVDFTGNTAVSSERGDSLKITSIERKDGALTDIGEIGARLIIKGTCTAARERVHINITPLYKGESAGKNSPKAGYATGLEACDPGTHPFTYTVALWNIRVDQIAVELTDVEKLDGGARRDKELLRTLVHEDILVGNAAP